VELLLSLVFLLMPLLIALLIALLIPLLGGATMVLALLLIVDDCSLVVEL